MSLLSYEGVHVNIPTNLEGIHFEFIAGSLTIHCRDFTGNIVLSKRDVSTAARSPSKRRTIDLSASDDDDEADAKRLRPNFLNEVEQTLLRAQLNDSQSSSSSHIAKSKEKETKVKTLRGSAPSDLQKDGQVSSDSAKVSKAMMAGSAAMGKKTPLKKYKRKAKNAKDDAASFSSPESRNLKSRKLTPDSSKKRRQTLKTQAESSSGMHITTGLLKPKPAAAVKWEMVEALGNAPFERWGHTATKISDERVVVYGGTDDDEQTLGDLHVFDMNTRRWTTPLNCETITRTWHDAVFLSSKNLVLVFGGERNSTTKGELDILSDIMVLDTECFLWYPPAIRGSPPSARSGHTCTAIGNEVVVFGGSGGRKRQSSVHILDSDDWNWKTVKVDGKAPSVRTYHSAVTVGDDKIVYFGGNDSCKSFNEVHVLQKVKKTANDVEWTWLHPCTVGVPPQERTGHSATLLNDGKILIYGGWDPQRDDASAPTSVFNDFFLLDTQSWEWQPATFADEESAVTLLRGRVGHGAVLHSDGRVYVFGGQDGAERRLKDICTVAISQRLDKETCKANRRVASTTTGSVLETKTM